MIPRLLLVSLLCLVCGALGVAIAYLFVGDRQPGYLIVAGTAGVLGALRWTEQDRRKP